MPQPDRPDLTPAQEGAVRDLLAAARHTGPVPDDVAARLDARLAELVGERSAVPSDDADDTASDVPAAPAPVVALASRRRRRRVGAALLAAAAVVVGGVAVSEVLPRMAGQESATSDESLAGGGASDEGEAAPEDRAAMKDVPRLSSDTFRRDVLRTRRTTELRSPAAASDPEAQSGGRGESYAQRDSKGDVSQLDGRATLSLSARCGLDAGRGRPVLVRYDGRRALLVLRPPRDGRQVADLYRCGSAELLRSLDLPAR